MRSLVSLGRPKDNGKDVSWRGAVNYCRKLKLGGYMDWRRAGDTKGGVPENFTWHVKGNLYLTGDEWSGRRVDRDGKPIGYAYYFDFNEGRSASDPIGWPYPHKGRRALCVRGPGDLPGGPRTQ